MDNDQKEPIVNNEKVNALASKLAEESKKSFLVREQAPVTTTPVIPVTQKAPEPETKPETPPQTPEEIAQSMKDKEILQPLRTYQSDIADTIRNKKTSVASISIAEQKRKERTQTTQTASDAGMNVYVKDGLLTLGSIVLVIAGIAGAVGLYYVYQNRQPAPIVRQAQSLIPSDASVEVKANGLTKQKIIDAVHTEQAKTPEKAGSITYIDFVQTATNTPQTSINTVQFLTALQSGIPSALARAFDKKFMLGVYMNDANPAFLLLSISSFDSAFAGMLNWEKTMSAGLAPVLIPGGFKDIAPKFEDIIIKNKDARVLHTIDGAVVLIYSFLDEKTLAITTSEKAFGEIANRFVTSKLVR